MEMKDGDDIHKEQRTAEDKAPSEPEDLETEAKEKRKDGEEAHEQEEKPEIETEQPHEAAETPDDHDKTEDSKTTGATDRPGDETPDIKPPDIVEAEDATARNTEAAQDNTISPDFHHLTPEQQKTLQQKDPSPPRSSSDECETSFVEGVVTADIHPDPDTHHTGTQFPHSDPELHPGPALPDLESEGRSGSGMSHYSDMEAHWEKMQGTRDPEQKTKTDPNVPLTASGRRSLTKLSTAQQQPGDGAASDGSDTESPHSLEESDHFKGRPKSAAAPLDALRSDASSSNGSSHGAKNGANYGSIPATDVVSGQGEFTHKVFYEEQFLRSIWSCPFMTQPAFFRQNVLICEILSQRRV